jgi:radical SAM superfamily enzyme YgiQ (UPF0313 family)
MRLDLARDEDILPLMYKAGCRTVYVGVESINPATLKSYNKGQTVSDIEFGIKMFHKHKIRIHGMFVLGADTDTVETVRATTEFACRTGIETVQFLILTPLPGTPFHTDLLAQGRLGITDYSFYDAHHVVYEPALMTPYQLQREVLRANTKFYSLTRIFGDILRMRFFEAIVKLYARRLELRLERLSGWFVDGLKSGLDHVHGLIETRQERAAT